MYGVDDTIPAGSSHTAHGVKAMPRVCAVRNLLNLRE